MILIRFLIALVLTMAVPVGGYWLSSQVKAGINSDLAALGEPSIQSLCALPEAGTDLGLVEFCSDMGRLDLLKKGSMVAGLFGIGIPVVFLFASLLAGSNRRRLSTIFPITVHATLVFMPLSVAMQGAILTYGLFVAESYYLNRVHIWLIAIVGFGAAGAAYNLFMQTFSFAAKYENFVHGVAVREDKAPGLHSFVAGLAEKLGASKPDNIIVGLEPNFFVTSAEVRIPDSPTPLEGETLYVSLPLARLMTVPEFAGIIGHELGHFRGEDTAYSLKFAPVYAGLGNALMATSRQSGEGLGSLAKLPAKAMLTFMMDVFAMNERSIGRERELRADEAGAEASSGMALITSLMKISLYGQIWGYIQGENLHRLANGKTTRNLSSLLESRARFDVEHKKMDEIIDAVAETRISHPTDTHPTVSERMKSLSVARGDIDKSQIMVPETSAVLLFRNAFALEEKLTVMEHKLMVAAGYVEPGSPVRGAGVRHFAPIYRVAAAIIMADGIIDINEIHRAELAGEEAFPGFDSTDFRQACDYVDDTANSDLLARDLNDSLDQGQKVTLIGYLKSIAESDGEVDWAEQDLIDTLAAELGVATA